MDIGVGFSEDDSRKRRGSAALNVFKNDTSTKQGIVGKRPKATWNEDYLKKLLKIKV